MLPHTTHLTKLSNSSTNQPTVQNNIRWLILRNCSVNLERSKKNWFHRNRSGKSRQQHSFRTTPALRVLRKSAQVFNPPRSRNKIIKTKPKTDKQDSSKKKTKSCQKLRKVSQRTKQWPWLYIMSQNVSQLWRMLPAFRTTHRWYRDWRLYRAHDREAYRNWRQRSQETSSRNYGKANWLRSTVEDTLTIFHI